VEKKLQNKFSEKKNHGKIGFQDLKNFSPSKILGKKFLSCL